VPSFPAVEASVTPRVAFFLRAFGGLHDQTLAHELLAIEVVNGIICISAIFKVHKAIALFEIDATNITILIKEIFNFPFPHITSKTSHI